MTSEELKKHWDTLNMSMEHANKSGAFTLLQSKAAAEALLAVHPLLDELRKDLEKKESATKKK